MINIYIPKEIDSKNRGQLFPLLRPFFKGESFTDAERKEIYHISEDDINFVNTIGASDWVILPMSWNYYQQYNKLEIADKLIKEAFQNKKKVLSFTSGDFGVSVPEYKNLIVLRVSGEQSRFPENHLGLPAFKVDPLKNHFNKESVIHSKYDNIPVIGFCGQTNSSVINALKEVSKVMYRNVKFYFKMDAEIPQKIQSTSYLRDNILSKIKASNLLKSNFIERKKYRAGATSKEEREVSTLEFYQNMIDSDYVVCVRGAGNFSVRFYETLAMGRIPIFINTDCILPLSNSIEWKNHVVWIELDEIETMNSKIIEFHNSLSSEKLKKLQQANRTLWEESLTLGGFFKAFFTNYNLKP